MCAIKQVTDQKAHGAHFTPHELACFVARRIIKVLSLENMDAIRVLDPACGDGELFLAFTKTLQKDALTKTTVIGVETTIQAIETAKVRLDGILAKQIILQCDDFLDVCETAITQQQLFFNTPKQSSSIEPVDVVIANPPYVRTQVLGAAKAQSLATAFGLSGRVDLYHAFLVAMTRQLVHGGVLGVITSNRYLSSPISQNIVALVKYLIFFPLSTQEREEREQNIEILVAQAFGVDEELASTVSSLRKALLILA